MSAVNEAIARYHKILDAEAQAQSESLEKLKAEMQEKRLEVASKPVCPFLRPHFISGRQMQTLEKQSEALLALVDRVLQAASVNPILMNRLDLLPAERTLATGPKSGKRDTVAASFDTFLEGNTCSVTEYHAGAPTGIYFSDMLQDIFFDLPVMKEFRKKYKVAKHHSAKPFHAAILKAYKEFAGKDPKAAAKPNLGLLTFRQPFETAQSRELELLAKYFTEQGTPAMIVHPEQLEYKNGVLRAGDFVIHTLFRRIPLREFVVNYDALAHPLIRAYRDNKVCIVNSFRAEVGRKRTVFELLTDPEVTAKFAAAEKKLIQTMVPTTRLVSERRTTWQGEEVDLLPFIQANRESLILRPTDEQEEKQSFEGAQMDESAWEKAVKTALRSPYVVQSKLPVAVSNFPVNTYGMVDTKAIRVSVRPHLIAGKAVGASAWLTPDTRGFSTASGVAPLFVL